MNVRSSSQDCTLPLCYKPEKERGRETETERKRERQRLRQREREKVCKHIKFTLNNSNSAPS